MVCQLCLNDPDKRLSAKQALKHDFFKLDLSEDNNLDAARERMIIRKETKVYNPQAYKNFEGLSLSKLNNELLRFGLDIPDDVLD